MHRQILTSIIFALTTHLVLAWSGYDVTGGPLRLSIEEIPDVEGAGPFTAKVRVENRGTDPVEGTVEVRDLVDDWRVEGKAAAAFSLAPKANQAFGFTLRSGPFLFSALYPVHAYATVTGAKGAPLHAVRIFEVKGAAARRDEPPAFAKLTAPADGALLLWTTRAHRMAWSYSGKEQVLKPVGWGGSDPTCAASLTVGDVRRNDVRPAIQMHPPWRGGHGTVFCDYIVTLPDQKPIQLTFANAIRDHGEKEPASDGVLFRVWAGEKKDGSDARELYANFTDAKVWAPGRTDLSAYAGKTIVLRLESHPGPKNNTTCDSSYWAEPTVICGTQPTAEEDGFGAIYLGKAGVAAGHVIGKITPPDGKTAFVLEGGEGRLSTGISVQPGRRGMLDAAIGMACQGGWISFRGFDVDLDYMPASRRPSAWTLRDFQIRKRGARTDYVHRLEHQGKETELTISLTTDGPVLRVAANCPTRITKFSVGPWAREARRVYYGHGYCIEDPEPFQAGFGGHNGSTSHAACDFEGGMSVLQAVDNPPDRLVVNPQDRIYALRTHMDCVLTLVPGANAFDCAVAYRPYYDKKPSAGVKDLAGRFCFDIWGGRYGFIADQMQRMIDYGLTDSFITVHNWQRWGYDYKLPDIYPPNPDLGTLEDMKRIGDVCGRRDIPWGLHDNYIDFYPDAEDYTYRDVYFRRDGTPHRAWYNQGRDALSYKWRPDHIMPFVKRNYRLIKQGLKPTHSFLDVFTSQGCVDYLDHDGQFHSFIETRKHWGEAFAHIRDTLGGDAPTTSEAGHDQLIGYLDGADCQWLRLDPRGGRFLLRLPCADWERVPWYDAVNHHRFILHGVGYSSRYQGGKPRRENGINSDDYISAEVLSGHALMVDSGSWGRKAVRKYYLAQGLARELALGRISSVLFADDDIHRQTITWNGGASIHVNRGETDWTVKGRVLPQYGYLAEYGKGCWSCIEKRGEHFVESSHGPSGSYCNARTLPDGPRLYRVAPHVEDFKQHDGRTFSWTLVWDIQDPVPGHDKVFVHFCTPDHYGSDKIRFQDDHGPSTPTDRWSGELRMTRTMTIPEDITKPVKAFVGLHGDRGRARLLGHVDGESRILVGTLHATRAKDGSTKIRLETPPPADPPPARRWNPGRPVIDFNFARTDGAFRVQACREGLKVIPLPESPAFTIALNLDRLAPDDRTATGVNAVSPADGTRGASIAFEVKGRDVTFSHDGKSEAYLVTLE